MTIKTIVLDVHVTDIQPGQATISVSVAYPVPPEALIAPHDGGPKFRPHTIRGWWQLWSGGLCVALVTPEDVEVLRAAGRNSTERVELPAGRGPRKDGRKR